MNNALRKLPPTPEKGVLLYLQSRTVGIRGQSIRTGSLYFDYRKWARVKAISTVSTKRFYAILEEYGYRRRSSQHGKVYRDIRFIN